jgi:hypothetical protein
MFMELSLPPISCPHCYEENPALAEQRCAHCGLSMFSDQEQQVRWQRIQPLLAAISQASQALPTSESPLKSYAAIQPMLSELQPYVADRSWLEGFFEQMETQLRPYQRAFHKARQQLWVHLLILLILSLVPALALLMGAEGWLALLLCLPVLGWAYLGVWRYAQQLK